MFQPRVIGGLVAIGVVFQSAWLFLALSAVLSWSTLVPTRNLFDAFYNRFVARPRGLTSLGVAPAPRLFAQAMATTVTFVIGAMLVLGATKTASVVEVLAVIAVGAAVFKDFCGAACVYHRVRGLMTRQHAPAPSAAHGC